MDLKTIVWDSIRISGGADSIIAKGAKKMIQNEALITQWAPALLLMELNNLLWKDADHIEIKKLWDYLCTYCYLPRLRILPQFTPQALNRYLRTAQIACDKFFCLNA